MEHISCLECEIKMSNEINRSSSMCERSAGAAREKHKENR
jgi:hypothetical protein